MTESEAMNVMIAPGTRRPGKYREGVIQIQVTRACDLACFGCTQGSQLRGKPYFMSLRNFKLALQSLHGWWGVVGVFGGNPALHPHFDKLCEILRDYFPKEQRGLWCNHPRGHGVVMAETFDPKVSNLNCHLVQEAYDEFKRDWPASQPFGLTQDSRHSPPWVAMKDLTGLPGRRANTEENRWDLISGCDINKHWSAMMAEFRGELRAWFCEIAGAQSINHQEDPSYPDTGLPVHTWEDNDGNTEAVDNTWWQMPMSYYAPQARKHCHECGIPLRGHGALAAGNPHGTEQHSATHSGIFKPKRADRKVELVLAPAQLGRVRRVTDYISNAKK